MRKSVKDTMEYEMTPLTKPGKSIMRQQLKKDREKNINRMASWEIVWYLTRKHRLGLLITSNTILLCILVVR